MTVSNAQIQKLDGMVGRRSERLVRSVNQLSEADTVFFDMKIILQNFLNVTCRQDQKDARNPEISQQIIMDFGYEFEFKAYLFKASLSQMDYDTIVKLQDIVWDQMRDDVRLRLADKEITERQRSNFARRTEALQESLMDMIDALHPDSKPKRGLLHPATIVEHVRSSVDQTPKVKGSSAQKRALPQGERRKPPALDC